MASGVEFDEDKLTYGQARPQSHSTISPGYQYPNSSFGASQNENTGGMTSWLIRHHLAKSENAAQYVLVGIIAINIIITVIVLKFIL